MDKKKIKKKKSMCRLFREIKILLLQNFNSPILISWVAKKIFNFFIFSIKMPPKYQNKKKSIYSRAVGAVKGRYFKGKGYSRPKISTMVKDIAVLKSVINAEKKRFDLVTNSVQLLGQANINTSGHSAFDITPMPAEGVTYGSRTGSSIKLHSSYIKFQFWHQSNTVNPIKIMMYIVQVKGVPRTASTALTQFLLPNLWLYNQNSVSIYDYGSEMNPDFFGTFRVLRKKRVYIKQDSITGSQPIPQDVVIKMKYNKGKGHHIRFDGDSNTVSDGQILMFLVADNGNLGTISTLQGIPTQVTLTGCQYQYDFKHYFYDN